VVVKVDLAEAIISQVRLQLKDTKDNYKQVKHSSQLSMIVTEEQVLITKQECKVKLVGPSVAEPVMAVMVTVKGDKVLTDTAVFLTELAT
jgi:hypothetical protein